MIVNVYFNSTEFRTYEFRSLVRFLFFLKFRLAIGIQIDRIILVENQGFRINSIAKCCKYFMVNLEVKNEFTKAPINLLQKVCDWCIYEKQLKQILASDFL